MIASSIESSSSSSSFLLLHFLNLQEQRENAIKNLLKQKEDKMQSEEQELYDLIYKRDWDKALQLLQPVPHQNKDAVMARKVGTRSYTLFQAVL